ncbi:hypothetical protein HX109_10670 [Galbibacter sp. BG1]|uniref:DUF6520 family protein n=1 Tax=Galbibacter sp. BG1 TaxID=1170699 RepID=UPI0015BBFA91|nr:DUF6520 family protein [Galbibacter sp. BG1]QLE01993.1 hypothetical protein HX109_10670 [Galbibacter sp. BG1]
MKNLKLMLPMLAFILAIGMSFAFVNISDDPSTDYIIRNGVFEPLNLELDCGPGTAPCEVQFEGETQKYQVYDDDNISSPKQGNGSLIIL